MVMVKLNVSWLGLEASGLSTMFLWCLYYWHAWQDIIAEDQATHSAMFVPIVAGSDKMTVSIATGHQQYHPVYMSPGNLTNVAQRAHGNVLLPVAFLPIPKSEYLIASLVLHAFD